MWHPAEWIRWVRPTALIGAAVIAAMCASGANADSGLLNAALGRWIDSEAAPDLAETLASHPRFRGEAIKVVSMRDGRALERASRLHQAVEQRLTQQLLQYPGVRIVWNESQKPCGTPQPVAYLLGVELEKDGSSNHKANIGMIDVSESVWVSGINLNWQGRLTATERSAFDRGVDAIPRGTIDSPIAVTESRRIAELMQQNLRCALPDGLQGPLYLTPSDPGAVAQISGQLRTQLTRTPFAAVTRAAEDAEWVLSLQSEPASGATHQLQLLLEDTARGVTQQVAAVYVVGLQTVSVASGTQSPPATNGQQSAPVPAITALPSDGTSRTDERLLSIMRLSDSDEVGVCSESEGNACVEVSFDVLKPAYLFVFSTRQRRLNGLSCAIWRNRSDEGELRYRLQIPASAGQDHPAVGVYAIAAGRRDIAKRLDRHLRAAEGMCGGSKPTDLNRWLAELDRLIAAQPQDIQWQAIALANSPTGVRRL